jgi:hypothetical protein
VVIRGKASVTCPACGTPSDCELVQSINTLENPEDKARLLAGELNVLACACGQRAQLAANVLYRDVETDYYCQVVPGGSEQATAEAAAAFAVSGAGGTQRIVPSLNALIEKIRILDVGLVDWAVEMTKVLLLASLGDLERVLLFEVREADVIHWILFDEDGRAPQRVSSPFASYDKLAARGRGAPKTTELRIDRAWAVEAVQAMVVDAN